MPGKRFMEAEKLLDPKKLYTVDEAVALIKKTGSSKFDESVELHARLGIDTKQSDQQIRITISLPHGSGKSKRVVAFVEAEKEAEAKQAGADIIGGEELIAEISQKGILNFDVAIATPIMMPKLSKLAKTLGPRGLMPNPKTDTVGTNVGKMVQEQKAGKLSFKNDDTGNIHALVGKVSFDEAKLKGNLEALLSVLKKAKPASSKGIFLRSITLTTTMGPAIKLELGA
ncbi:MAG: 50S ribosomal protein L1 [Patescibacteria group bacterium]